MPKVAKKLPRNNLLTNNSLMEDLEQEAPDAKLKNGGQKACYEKSPFNSEVGDWIAKSAELPSDISKMYPQTISSPNTKKINTDLCVENFLKTWQKNFSGTMKKQAEKRKNGRDSLLGNLSALVTHLEKEGRTLQENDKQLRQWYTEQMKISQQSVVVHGQKCQALKQIHAEYLKECEETEAANQLESKKLEKQLAANILALQQKLQQECRRKNVETLRKAMTMMMD